MADPWYMQYYTKDAAGKLTPNKPAISAAQKASGTAPAYTGAIPTNWKPGFETKQNVDFYGKPAGTANPVFFADAATADALARAFGGQVVTAPAAGSLNQNQERLIKLPDGQIYNAGYLADIWSRNSRVPNVAYSMLQQAIQPRDQTAAKEYWGKTGLTPTSPVYPTPTPAAQSAPTMQPAAATPQPTGAMASAASKPQSLDLSALSLGGSAPAPVDPWAFQEKLGKTNRMAPFQQVRRPFSSASLTEFLQRFQSPQGGF